jgi:hypothetical protein
VPTNGHNVPQALWEMMNQRGLVYAGGGYRTDKVVDWLFAMGYPISAPYWVRCNVAGVEKDILVQLFERRVLTYTPSNPAGWQVEMGNVGRYYYDWRYGSGPAGLYPQTNACTRISLSSVDFIDWCVESVEVRADGMQFNVVWTAWLSHPYVTKYADVGNVHMYLTDEQGRRYDHVAVGDDAARDVWLQDGQSAVILPAADSAARLAGTRRPE